MTSIERALESESEHARQVASGERFEFGRNWARFLKVLNSERIAIAEASLKQRLAVETLAGWTFLDVGCGSGLFSLAARRLGARVHSFDYDPESVACAAELKRRYFAGDPDWTIERGDVLDRRYLAKLESCDVVYSWGVLHHTGNMWQALANVAPLVKPGGKLFVALYNDQGWRSRAWHRVKRFYCSGLPGRLITSGAFISYWVGVDVLESLRKGKHPFGRLRNHGRDRGTARVTDWLDWLGGLPFEVAKPEQVFDFYKEREFRLTQLKTCAGGLGNNEYVFVRGA